jgi:hydrogenase nickel incorporation protein HypB
LNKIDLLPYVSFDVGRCVEYACRVNPRIRITEISATRGDGMDEWLGWVAAGSRSARRGVPPGLEQRIGTEQSWVATQGA